MTPGYTNYRTTPKHRTIYIPFEIKIRDMAKTIAKCEKDKRWRDGGFPSRPAGMLDKHTRRRLGNLTTQSDDSDYSIPAGVCRGPWRGTAKPTHDISSTLGPMNLFK